VDWVLHLASPASPAHYLRYPLETMRVGSLGTMNALELAREKRARFVLASTSEVYGDPLEHPQHESYWGNVNPIGPRSVYDESKRFAEALTAAYRREGRADAAIVRIFNTYGPRMRLDDGRAIPAFISQALAGEPITVAGDGQQTRSLCYVEDTVAGILALAAGDCPGPVNIGGSQEISMLALAEQIRDVAGSASPVEFIDLPVDDPRVRRPDTTLAREVLGWEQRVPFDEGLKRTLEWFAALRAA
jgi:dTDP-glucose 4,6-dehydratase